MNLFLFLLVYTSFFSTCFANVEKLVILGAGPAGLTSAIYTGQADLSPLVIEGEECEGQLETVYHMENYPGFPQGINGDELVQLMKEQAKKFGARFQHGSVVEVDLSIRPFRLKLSSDKWIFAETLIIALGSSKRWLGLESEEILKGKGVCGSASCEAPNFKGKEVVVVGGGDAALEEALALTEYAEKVTIIHRNRKLNGAFYLVERIVHHPKIQVILNSGVDEILDISKGKVTGIVLRNLETQETLKIDCEGVFVSIGRNLNTALFKDQLKLTAQGLIAVKYPTTQTSVPGVYAAGDVCDTIYRKAITAAGSGCMAALDIIRDTKEN